MPKCGNCQGHHESSADVRYCHEQYPIRGYGKDPQALEESRRYAARREGEGRKVGSLEKGRGYEQRL